MIPDDSYGIGNQLHFEPFNYVFVFSPTLDDLHSLHESDSIENRCQMVVNVVEKLWRDKPLAGDTRIFVVERSKPIPDILNLRSIHEGEV
jgi:hypothetical protein